MRAKYGGQSMTGALLRVLVLSPESARWDLPESAAQWEKLGYLHAPDGVRARREHDALVKMLAAAGAEVFFLSCGHDPGLDAVYAHDASVVTDAGAVCLRMGKPARALEPLLHRQWYESDGIPVLGEIHDPGTAEGGDLVWLDPATLLAGHGFRTNTAGIDQLGSLLKPHGIIVHGAPLPYGRGPGSCLHLMSLLSMLDERTILVDLPWLAVETVQLLRARGYRLIEIEPDERPSLACNVLALGNRTLLAFEENPATNRRLSNAGFRVITVPGSEIGINGGGGPTCLTRPLHRSAIED